MALSSEPKNRSSPRRAIVERLDAHAVAGQHQAPRGFGPQRDGKHAAQAGKATGIPLEKGGQNRFGVAVRVETMAELFQFGAQFQVVVNFAVEDDDRVAVGGEMGWSPPSDR